MFDIFVFELAEFHVEKIIFRVKKGNLLDFFRLFLSLLVSFVTRFVEVHVIYHKRYLFVANLLFIIIFHLLS